MPDKKTLALQEIAAFVEHELETRRTSMLPDVDGTDTEYIEEAESALEAVRFLQKELSAEST